MKMKDLIEKHYGAVITYKRKKFVIDHQSFSSMDPEGGIYVTALETSNVARKGDGQWIDARMLKTALKRLEV